MQGFNKINEYTICYIKQLAGCHRDILPILVNLKSNTIMKKPHRKYKKDIFNIQIISIKKQYYYFTYILIVRDKLN